MSRCSSAERIALADLSDAQRKMLLDAAKRPRFHPRSHRENHYAFVGAGQSSTAKKLNALGLGAYVGEGSSEAAKFWIWDEGYRVAAEAGVYPKEESDAAPKRKDRKTAAKGAADSFDTLTKLTKRTIQFAYIVFLRRVQGNPTATEDIAQHFKDCSADLAASVLHEAADAGALIHEDGHWFVTEAGLDAMRVHYVGWADQFSADDEKKALSDAS